MSHKPARARSKVQNSAPDEAAKRATELHIQRGTANQRNRHIELFLDWLDAKGFALPVNAEIMLEFNSYLNDEAYTNVGACRAHVWKWLMSPPSGENFQGIDTFGWKDIRWNAERKPKRLMGIELGSIVAHAVRVEKDCLRAPDNHIACKADPVLADNLVNAWGGFTSRERGITGFALAAGVRVSTLMSILPGDIVTNDADLCIYLRKDKIKAVEGRFIRLGCNCGNHSGYPSRTALCPLHSGYISPSIFPIQSKELESIQKSLGITGHSWRRTLALRLRAWAERSPHLVSGRLILTHLGWSDLKRWASYASDLRLWDNHKLVHSEYAIKQRCYRSAGDKITLWSWSDAVGKDNLLSKKVSIPQWRSEEQDSIPNSVSANGNSATGAFRRFVQVNKIVPPENAVKRMGEWVVPAPKPDSSLQLKTALNVDEDADWLCNPDKVAPTATDTSLSGLSVGDLVGSDFSSAYLQPLPSDDGLHLPKGWIAGGASFSSASRVRSEPGAASSSYDPLAEYFPVKEIVETRLDKTDKTRLILDDASRSVMGSLSMDNRPSPSAKPLRSSSADSFAGWNRRARDVLGDSSESVRPPSKHRRFSAEDVSSSTGSSGFVRFDRPVKLINSDEYRQIIRKGLRDVGLDNKRGWVIRVTWIDASKQFNVRGTCARCPFLIDGSGKKIAGRRCGMAFNGYVRDLGDASDLSGVFIEKNEEEHTDPGVEVAWPFK